MGGLFNPSSARGEGPLLGATSPQFVHPHHHHPHHHHARGGVGPRRGGPHGPGKTSRAVNLTAVALLFAVSEQ